jgi:hypothetical protein
VFDSVNAQRNFLLDKFLRVAYLQGHTTSAHGDVLEVVQESLPSDGLAEGAFSLLGDSTRFVGGPIIPIFEFASSR